MVMSTDDEEWRPGSFTKNFSWGESSGLFQLYECIKLGFNGVMEDTPRNEFRRRVQNSGRPDYIPLNFFLFNQIRDGIDYVVADELVFQALSGEHSPRFDKLALFAFNFSYAGKWTGASRSQRRPALWAYHYVRDRVARDLNWEVGSVTASDIQQFIHEDRRYKGETTRKLATNLHYLYSIGRLSEFAEKRVERWWVDALFLALDRLIEDRRLDHVQTPEAHYATLLSQSGFHLISGQTSLEKDLATPHLIALYIACGGRGRFSDNEVQDVMEAKLPQVPWTIPNDPDSRPIGAVHPTNVHILKSIPRACAMLARYVAGFETIGADELANFDPEEFIRKQTEQALEILQEKNIRPTMTLDELMKLTRER